MCDHFLPPFDNFTIDIAYPSATVFTQYNLKGKNLTRSLAAFGQVGFKVTPTLNLEVGARYTASRSINHVDVRQYGTAIRTDQKTTSDDVSYKVSLGWEASPTQYLYGFVATGFRPGGLNVPVAATGALSNLDPFKPEKVQNKKASCNEFERKYNKCQYN